MFLFLSGAWRDSPFDHTSDVRLLILIGEIFERFLLRLWNEQRRQDAGEHDERKRLQAGFRVRTCFRVGRTRNHQKIGHKCLHDLHSFDIVQQLVAKRKLCNNCTNLAACCGNTMCGGAVTGGEGFSRDDKRGRVWAKVLKKIGKAIQEDKSVLARACGIEGSVGKGYRSE